MSYFSGKKILVTGGTGMVGVQLVNLLLSEGADITVVSLDDSELAPRGVRFVGVDLRERKNCINVCKGIDIVFHLAGIKGSPQMTATQPATFFVPTILFNTNMLEAARLSGVSKLLYTSTVGVYSPAEVFFEDSVWETFPSKNDWFAGWAKRMGELQAEAYKIEYGWNGISIARPANIYGPFDNFDSINAMVIPSLIRRAIEGENPLKVWGDGTPIRDFIHARDVARGMMLLVEKGINVPVNLGSGQGISIKEIAETIACNVPGGPVPIEWDTDKPKGDNIRVMDSTRAKQYGFQTNVSIEDGVKETIEWYVNNRNMTDKRYRYNAFTEEVGNT